MAGGSGSVSLERPTHPLSPGGPRVLWIRKGYEPRAPGTPIHQILGPEPNKEIEREEN